MRLKMLKISTYQLQKIAVPLKVGSKNPFQSTGGFQKVAENERHTTPPFR